MVFKKKIQSLFNSLIRNSLIYSYFVSLNQQKQKQLISQWKLAFKQNIKLFDDIKDIGFRCYSQFDEDGIILYLLTLVGKKNNTVVEICCGDGQESMSANLVINHGFKGYLFDGSLKKIETAKKFFSKHKECLLVKPTIKNEWITKENINTILSENGVEGEVDILAIDMDGIDYYVWEAIEKINPRICVFEINNFIPNNVSLTIPYSEDFDYLKQDKKLQDFRSVSPTAMNKLSERKGYTFVGNNKHGFNVFYVRNDLLNKLLPKPQLQSLYDTEWSKERLKDWVKIKDQPWVKI
tara:strand:+ start:231 stop:1115 length:885 start_codon:yes stop_codon:yes gene_type:complete